MLHCPDIGTTQSQLLALTQKPALSLWSCWMSSGDNWKQKQVRRRFWTWEHTAPRLPLHTVFSSPQPTLFSPWINTASHWFTVCHYLLIAEHTKLASLRRAMKENLDSWVFGVSLILAAVMPGTSHGWCAMLWIPTICCSLADEGSTCHLPTSCCSLVTKAILCSQCSLCNNLIQRCTKSKGKRKQRWQSKLWA